MPHAVAAERRPSGTYYKLCVRETDAVAAHLALQMGGCGRSLRLREQQPTPGESLRDMARTLWDEAVLLWTSFVDLIRRATPLLLGGPRADDPAS